MRRIKLIVAYDGTEYSGWQIQPEAPTIEMYLDKAIRELTGENVHVTGASRTDAGVHAYGNVAVFDTESTIPGDRFTFALNRFLPDSIVIQDSWEVSVDFHPRHCNTRKTYEYRILNTAVPLPQKRNFTWHVTGSIDIEKMKEAGVSNAQIFKQTGNSIVINVLLAIYRNLYNAMPYLFDDIRLGSFFSGIGAFEKAFVIFKNEIERGDSIEDRK